MSPIQILRSLVNERLAAAAEEIFGLFERTIIEYEGEIDRQRKLMDVVKPEMTTDSSGPQLSICEEEVPPGQQERNPSLVQEEPEPPQIKEEQEDLWSSQEVLKEADIIKFTFRPVSVKCDDGEEKAQCSWFNQTQPGETTEAEPLPRTSTEPIETEPDVEDCGASEPASSHTGERLFSCTYCGKGYKWKHSLQTHMRSHTGEKPFTCSVCGRSFCDSGTLKRHMRTHSNEKPFSCSICGKGFSQSGTCKRHMRTHSNDKSFSRGLWSIRTSQ